MPIHMVAQVAGVDFKVTLSRDGAGNYVAEAARLLRGERDASIEAPRVRVVDGVKERALKSLFDALGRITQDHAGGPDAPAAA
jgi:hypothetical protein